MSPLGRLIGGVRALLRRNAVERELDEELRAYVEAFVESKMSSGVSRADAERAARVAIGSIEAVKNQVRDAGWRN